MPKQLNALQEINAGITMQRVEVALKEVAIGVANCTEKGSVTLTLDVSPQKNTEGQVNIDAKVVFKKPTLKGHKSEASTDSTPMYISKNGLSAVREQPELDFDKSETVTAIK